MYPITRANDDNNALADVEGHLPVAPKRRIFFVWLVIKERVRSYPREEVEAILLGVNAYKLESQ